MQLSSIDSPWLAQSGKEIRFSNISLDQGLSQSVVVDIVQDDLGFLWFATQDGLDRYDGYQFEVFKSDPRNSNSLSNDFISALEKDSSGTIWIGTSLGGLNRYDAQTGQFTNYMHAPNDPDSLSENFVTAIDIGKDGSIWVGTSSTGLDRLDPKSGKVQHFRNDPENPSSLSANAILCVLEDTSGAVWVGTISGGLNRLDLETGKFTRYVNDEEDPLSLSSNSIQSLYQDRQGVLWVGTVSGGLDRFDSETGKFRHYANDPNDTTSLSHNWVLTILEDRWGRFWVGTNGGGVNLMDRSKGSFTRFQHDPGDSSSLANDQVWAIFEDNSGMLWFGTFGSGLSTYDPFKDKFLHIHSDPGNPQSLSNDLIWSIYQDDAGIFWIGTNGGGLNRFDPGNGEWRHYLADPTKPNSLSDNVIYWIHQDQSGLLWLGTNNGLNRFDPRTEAFNSFTTPSQVFSIIEDHLGNFWLGSSTGLYRFNKETGETDPFVFNPDDPWSLGGNVVLVVREDAQGNLWVGTSAGGLNLFDRRQERFTRYTKSSADPDSLSNNTVLAVFQASDGVLWIGTAGGLNKFDPQTGKFIAYRVADGLADDFVYGILEDSQKRLWVSTNRGISRFNPQTLEFKNYDKTDGLQGNEFNQGAYFKAQDGMLFFGGVNGLSAFYPDQVQDNPFVPPVKITHFDVFNKLVQFGPDAPIQQPIEVSPEIHLAYTDDFFDFVYAALHFSSPEEIQYAYRMEGLEKDWNYVGNRRFASYTNVPPGEYTFRVKATNSDGVWNEVGTAVKIIIPPPFWQTLWFRLLVLLGIIGGVSAGVVARIRSIENQRKKLELLVDERTRQLRDTNLELERSRDAAEAANRAKSTFLANMSHEFRTPLNAILGFVQVMLRDHSIHPEQKESLEVIYRSGEHLLGLINDVLEMSKIEAGRNTLSLRQFDLYHLLEGLEEMFALRAEDKNLSLSLQLFPQVPRCVEADEGKLRQVLMNLLGNAVKFTHTGQVILRVQPVPTPPAHPEEEAILRFEVKDTGPGISAQELGQLFEPFVQTTSGQQAQEGTGLGLTISQQFVRLMGGEIQVQSELDKGSTFSFELRVALASASEISRPVPVRRVVALEPGQPVYRILVVDDQEVNRKLLVKFFAPLDFDVREAQNGKQALELWEEWEPHLIWMDMRMPVMDGYEATRRIKATTRGQATVIVALTASSLEEERKVILSEGCDDYLRKPFLEADLYEMIAKHLGVRYIYEDHPSLELAEAVEGLAGETQEEALTVGAYQELIEHLAAAGADWLAELERLTILGDLDEITRLTRQIDGGDHFLAEGILNLANRFDHDRILVLIHQARSRVNHGTEE